MSNSIYSNSVFEVKKTEFTDPVLGEPVTGYGVFNKYTGVREAECRREFTARVLADGFEDQHLNPDKYVEVPDSSWGSDFGGEGVH